MSKQTKPTRTLASTRCPCGTGSDYAQCCLPYINGDKQPATAEILMRSRYTAYTQNAEAYLLHTWHPSTRPVQLNLAQQPAVHWLGLTILGSKAGTMSDETGTVEFIARFKEKGKAIRLHETSQFSKENGRWLYLHGE